jgi:hypothetical protein
MLEATITRFLFVPKVTLNEMNFGGMAPTGSVSVVQIKFMVRKPLVFTMHNIALNTLLQGEKKMKKINDRPLVAFDVDSTLIYWEHKSGRNAVLIKVDDHEEMFDVHETHVEALKKHAARGHTIIVWSAGGADWSEAVVKALQLEEYVDIVMPKPNWIYDDLSPNEFLPNNLYIYEDVDDSTPEIS